MKTPDPKAFSIFLTIALLSGPGLLTGKPQGRPPSAARPNVIFITIDTLRADHLGCYGYAQAETPTMDALARAGARFSRAYTPVPITLPAHSAIFTGSFPMATGMHDFSGNKLPAHAVTLAKVLRDHGYTTAAFIGAAVLDSRFGINQGFETYFDYFDFSRLDETNLDQMERRGDLVTEEALRWLRLNPRQPFLLWIHLYDPHHPYTPPEPYATRFRSRPYDGEIAFADTQVGQLVAALKERGVFAGSVVVLAGDHGEGLGEHDEKTHGFYIYNSTLHVPLVIKIPGIPPHVVDDEVSLVDVMPTVLQALKIQAPASAQGRSLLSQILGRPGQAKSAASPLYAETFLPLLHFRWSQLRSLESGGWKYIDAPKPELYYTGADPGETKNLYASEQSRAHELRDRLFSLLRRFTPIPSGAPGEKELTDPALLERLKSLGYVAVSAGIPLSGTTGKSLPDPKDRIQVYDLVSEGMADGQRGRYDESLRKLREAEKAEPTSLVVQYLMGINYFRKKAYAQAIARFQKTLELDPKFALATFYLGLTHAQVGSYNDAIISLNRALQLDPTNFSAAFNLGAVYTRLNRVEEAIQSLDRALTIYPDYAQAHEALGELYLYQKRVDEAIGELERAVALAPGMRQAHLNLGKAYAAKGLQEKAQREFDLAKGP